MMQKLKTVLMIAITVLFLCSCAQLSKSGGDMSTSGHLTGIIRSGELVVGTLGNMPPLNITAKDGEVIGYEIDIAGIMAKALGVKLKVKTMPFFELLPALEMNTVDIVISGMTITPARNLRFAFVGPYFESGKAFLTKSETLAKITDATELDSPATKVAALKGSTSQKFIETVMPRAQLMTTSDYDEAISLLLQDEVHALVADYPICIFALFRYPDAGFVSIHTTLTYEPYGIALPANDPHFMNWVENFLGNLEGAGTLELLKRKWFGNGDWIGKVR